MEAEGSSEFAGEEEGAGGSSERSKEEWMEE
jgi:hypothetical protein